MHPLPRVAYPQRLGVFLLTREAFAKRLVRLQELDYGELRGANENRTVVVECVRGRVGFAGNAPCGGPCRGIV